MNNDIADDDNTAPNQDLTRSWLALGVPGTSMVLLIVISFTYFLVSSDKAAAAQTVFNTTLPLIGTWVGTVLAFYFTSHNFDAAAKNARAMVKQLTPKEKLKLILVKDVWIPIENAVTLSLDKEDKQIKLTDMINKLEKKDRERLPMLDPEGRVKYIAHRSLIERFMMNEITHEQRPVEDLSLEDMLKAEKYQKVLTGGFRTLQATSNLADAKDFMEKVENCSDVFATEDGTPNTKVLGWVTNVIVAEQAAIEEA